MAKTEMNGQQIVEHFEERLARLEASGALPCALPLLRLSAPPPHLVSLSSSYLGTPALFPASWAPSFPCLASTLTRLLHGILQVEVFRLQYEQDNDDVAVLASPYKEPVSSKRSTNMEPSYVSSSENCELLQPGEKAVIHKSCCLHPIPVSTSEFMDFDAFMSESYSLLKAHKRQLLYLTWRSLPEQSLPASMPEDFCSFLDNIIRPITTPEFIAPNTIKQRNLWMGSLVTSRIHFDALDNVHVCISGKKVVHLYSPSELPNLYPEPWNEGSTNNFSQIGSALIASQKEHARYFQISKRFTTELNPGEAIFIPAGWWHEVFTLQYTVSVNMWFGPSSNALYRPTLLHLKSVRV